jgi:formylmethanofuran dehydrogenase subunit E-like metal-binding protein
VHAVKILLTSNANPKQYYLVEVRMKTGFDAALPVAGVLITYVNENLTIGPVRVMDGDPSVSELEDAVWGVGQTFKDSTLNLAVRVIEKTGNSYRIIISGNSQHSISTRLTDEITPVAKCHNVFTESANSWGNLLIQDYRSIRDQERRRLFPSLFDEMP